MASLPVHVTAHAIERYRRRVENVSEAEAIARLSGPVVEQAVSAGCCAVILASGHKLVLVENRVVTVKPRHKDKRRHR